jgi:O-antigen/teichoic acid export membrane protein
MAEEEQFSKRKVVPQRDTLWLSGADGINLIFGIIIHVILTRALLSDDYGTFVLLLDFFHVCVILVDLGLPTLIARDGARLGSNLGSLTSRVISIQFPLMLMIGLLGAYIGVMMFGGWLVSALFLALAAGLQVITYSLRAGMRSLGEARWEAIVRVADRGVVAVLMVCWANGTVEQFAQATLFGPIVALGITGLIWLRKIKPSLQEPKQPIPEINGMRKQELVSTGLPFLFASAALVINVRIEKLLLGLFAGPDDVAVFQIAWLGFIAGYGPILSLRAVLLSWFGEVRDDFEKLSHRYRQASIACVILCPIGIGIGMIIGPIGFEALFPDYANVVNKPFLALLFAWLFHAMASPSLALIQVGKKPWNYARILWAGISLSAAACLYLIPTQSNSVMGAAVAACLASFFVFALAFYGVRNGWATPFNVKPMV